MSSWHSRKIFAFRGNRCRLTEARMSLPGHGRTRIKKKLALSRIIFWQNIKHKTVSRRLQALIVDSVLVQGGLSEKIYDEVEGDGACQEHHGQEGSSSRLCIRHLLLLKWCTRRQINVLNHVSFYDKRELEETSAKSGKPMKLQ